MFLRIEERGLCWLVLLQFSILNIDDIIEFVEDGGASDVKNWFLSCCMNWCLSCGRNYLGHCRWWWRWSSSSLSCSGDERFCEGIDVLYCIQNQEKNRDTDQ